MDIMGKRITHKAMIERLNWLEINLKNYQHNFNSVRKLIGTNVKIMAVVKANAYGHGLVEIARQAQKSGAGYLGVVCLHEARLLRESGNRLPILIFNYIEPNSVEAAIKLDTSLTVMDEKVLKVIDKSARRQNKLVKIHIKIDTGMHRAGMLPGDALRLIPSVENYKNVYLEGVFTHLATSDEKSLDFTKEQLTLFARCISKLKENGINPPLIHAANSGAVLRLPSAYYDMVRPGIIMYGLAPSADFRLPFHPKPVLSWKSIIAQIRNIGKGETVGYGRTFKAAKKTMVGLVPVGYADGLRRELSNKWHVLVKGRKAPIIGRISMDQMSVDLSQIPNVEIGGEIVIIGKQGKDSISAEDMAAQLRTINYEVISTIGERVSRVYLY